MISLGPFRPLVDARLTALERDRFVHRLWDHDVALWTRAPERRAAIVNRLGWLTVVEPMAGQVETLRAFADEVRADGFAYAVLCGMGGSSLCAEVLRETYGVAPGFLDLRVLDNTSPAAVRDVEASVDLARTLFLVSSKSGTTTESLAFFRYFYNKVGSGRQFVAMTDPGTPLEALAREQEFRRVFLNPPDIGGRYAALSYVGLVPGVLLGLDIARLLDGAATLAEACRACVALRDNAGVLVGVIEAELARAGRDKLTLVLSPRIASFGSWLEQLIAESTGKEGRGLVPVADEPLGEPHVYGSDRFFVSLRTADEPEEERLHALEATGHPVLRWTLPDTYSLGGEFFRWEFATAVAGALFGINPFDEPNVAEAKEATTRLLGRMAAEGRLPEEPPRVERAGVSVFADPALDAALTTRIRERQGDLSEPAAWIGAHLVSARAGDYVAFLAYVRRTQEQHGALQRVRVLARDRLGRATTLGYGPRYLHSTGQLHKGGPNTGLFLLLTAEEGPDVAIPGERYTFGELRMAQALGDLHVLRARDRRVLRLHIAADFADSLARLTEGISRFLAP